MFTPPPHSEYRPRPSILFRLLRRSRPRSLPQSAIVHPLDTSAPCRHDSIVYAAGRRVNVSAHLDDGEVTGLCLHSEENGIGFRTKVASSQLSVGVQLSVPALHAGSARFYADWDFATSSGSLKPSASNDILEAGFKIASKPFMLAPTKVRIKTPGPWVGFNDGTLFLANDWSKAQISRRGASFELDSDDGSEYVVELDRGGLSLERSFPLSGAGDKSVTLRSSIAYDPVNTGVDATLTGEYGEISAFVRADGARGMTMNCGIERGRKEWTATLEIGDAPTVSLRLGLFY